MLARVTDGIYRTLISLKLAVLLLGSLTLALIVATVVESAYDTATAQYYVYRAGWFRMLLVLLGLNILAVALSRLPWKKRHIPFLGAHAGILMLLVGAWISQGWGIDGMLRIDEGQTQSVVELDQPLIVVEHEMAGGSGNRRLTIPFPWRPPGVQVGPVDLPHDLVVERFISRADPVFSFEASSTSQASTALQLKFTTKRGMGGMPAMAASQEIWLWAGRPEWQVSDIGPARVFLDKMPSGPGPWIWLRVGADGSLSFEALSMRQEKSSGRIPAGRLKALASASSSSVVLDPGWKAIQIEIRKMLPRAMPKVDYVEAKIQYGTNAPSSAILLRSPSERIWLGLGDRAVFEASSGKLVVGYFPRRVVLPFGIRLDRFMLERYPGSSQPASFSSRVSVMDQAVPGGGERLISMNEPLEHRGITFYQSSYEEGQPRPTVSIFSVNQDPGRGLKYLGSLVLVLGIVWFYVNKRIQVKGRASA